MPIAYAINDITALTSHFGKTLIEMQMAAKTVTAAEFRAAGTVEMGYFSEINLTTGQWVDPWEGFVDNMEEQSVLAPWLLEPEIWALAGAAYIEGRSLSEAELAGTEWWQTHNDAERAWLQLVSSNPAEAERYRDDTRRSVSDMLSEAGINNADEIMVGDISLADWMADRFTMGTWSNEYIQDQITLIADPLLEGERDEALMNALNGIDDPLDTTRSREDEVRRLYRTWLGPVFGAVSDGVIEEWASKFRDDPDAEINLTEFLQQQRVTLFPQYEDRSLSYDAIAQPWKNFLSQAWGLNSDEYEDDEFFTELIRTNDAIEAGRMARQEGFKRGVGKVRTDALTAMQESFGGQVMRAIQ
ncbi:MAG: hypothetical protein ABIJ75_02480 [Actinomycetota bacterium]